ncbi:FxsA family protein [Aestuariimicrobium soli]|uniref:FxsA family protein n=1 Tax=Aestuariimicrobium soli TaxID=2035834 RepID=UPI003EC04F78
MARTPRRWLTPLLVVIFVGLPILEVFLLVKVGELIGVLPTIGLLVVTAVLGAWLMKREGAKAWRGLRDAFGEGKVPSRELSDGALVLAGGLLLTLPGFTTDVVGLLCLLPFTRPLPRRLLSWFAERQVDRAGLGGIGTTFSTGITRMRGDVIPGEVVDDATSPSTGAGNGATPDDPGRAIEGRVIEGRIDD